MNEQMPSLRANVLRFTIAVGAREPASPAVVRRMQQSPLTSDLLASLAVRDIALAVHEADRFVDQADAGVPFESLPPAAVDQVIDRSAIAMHLGDPVKRAVTDERAALTILRGINAGIRTGVIPDTSPLCRIDISSARQLAKLAMHGGLEYLAGRSKG